MSVLLSSADILAESNDDGIPGLPSNDWFGSKSLLNYLFEHRAGAHIYGYSMQKSGGRGLSREFTCELKNN